MATHATAAARSGTQPGVMCYRGFRLASGQDCGHLEPPVGAVVVVLLLEGELGIGEPPGDPIPVVPYRAPVCGLRTRALFVRHCHPLTGIEVSLAPWAAFRLFGVSMRELAHSVVELDALLPPGRASALMRRLAATSEWTARFDLVDTELGDLLAHGHTHAQPVAQAWHSLNHGPKPVSVSRLAEQVGLSESQLGRRFAEQIGVTPKAAARIVRLRRMLRLLARGSSTADAALLAGYYDQAHFSREFKAMTSVSPGRFLHGEPKAG